MGVGGAGMDATTRRDGLSIRLPTKAFSSSRGSSGCSHSANAAAVEGLVASGCGRGGGPAQATSSPPLCIQLIFNANLPFRSIRTRACIYPRQCASPPL